MHFYRLLHPHSRIDDLPRCRRPVQDHPAQRVYQLPPDRPPVAARTPLIVVHDVIATCPVCANELTITRLHCRGCGSALEGEFGVGRFGRLDREQLSLLESFLRSRGNLKEMERELGISYPTVRGRVDALVRALGFGEPGPDDPDAGTDLDTADWPESPAVPSETDVDQAARRREILERLARKEIGAEDAAEALRDLGRAG